MFLKKIFVVGLLCLASTQAYCHKSQQKTYYKSHRVYSKNSIHKVCARLMPYATLIVAGISLGLLDVYLNGACVRCYPTVYIGRSYWYPCTYSLAYEIGVGIASCE